MNRIKRFTAFMLIMGAMLSLCSFAMAEEEKPNENITIVPMGDSFSEINGTLDFSVKIDNKNDYPITLELIGQGGGAIARAESSSKDAVVIPANSTNNIIDITSTLTGKSNQSGDLKFFFKSSSNELLHSFCDSFSINRVIAEEPAPEETPTADTEFRIRTSSVDPAGVAVSTPSGDYGEDLTLRLPLVCTKGYVYDVKVTPVLSTDVEKFPFDIDLVDYTLCYPGSMNAGQVIEFMYPLRLSKKATVGVKQVDFTVTYRNGEGELKSGTVSLFVNVRKGLTATSEDATSSVPRLIIESYSLSSDKIYAGETFDLNFDIRNTSSSENIQNIQIRVKDSGTTATIVPANGGSNSLYVSKISRGESSSQKVSLQTAPDAEAKAYTLSLEFTYESASTNAAHTTTETISIPILQKIRLKCDDPVIYDEMGWVGSGCSMYVRMYNMGRSSVYNCMVDVEGQGLKMEESYFGGTLAPGSTLSADFSVIPSEAGDIQGTIVISYEDVYGEPGEERLPFSLYVEDPAAMMPDPMEDDMMTEPEPEKKGLPWWGWVLGAGAAGGGGTVGIKALRRRRERMLEEDI